MSEKANNLTFALHLVSRDAGEADARGCTDCTRLSGRGRYHEREEEWHGQKRSCNRRTRGAQAMGEHARIIAPHYNVDWC